MVAPTDARAVLFLDGHSSHVTPELMKALEEDHIDHILFVPHARHIQQPLDLVLYAKFKKDLLAIIKEMKSDGVPFSTEAENRNGTIEAAEAVQRSFVPRSIRRSFARAGLYPASSQPLMSNPCVANAPKLQSRPPRPVRSGAEISEAAVDPAMTASLPLAALLESELLPDEDSRPADLYVQLLRVRAMTVTVTTVMQRSSMTWMHLTLLQLLTSLPMSVMMACLHSCIHLQLLTLAMMISSLMSTRYIPLLSHRSLLPLLRHHFLLWVISHHRIPAYLSASALHQLRRKAQTMRVIGRSRTSTADDDQQQAAC